MSEQLQKFSVGDLATVARSSYTVGINIADSSALVVDTRSVEHGDLLPLPGLRQEQYRVLIDDKLYNLYESELQ